MSKHTPGPWRLSERSNFGNQIEGYSGQHLDCDGYHDDGYRTIASYQPCCASDRHDEQQANALANARLIAAAPELLDALELWQKLGNEGASFAEWESCQRMRDTAIAKAKGEA